MLGCESQPQSDVRSDGVVMPSESSQKTQDADNTKEDAEAADEAFTWLTPFEVTGNAIGSAATATGDGMVYFFTGQWLDDDGEEEVVEVTQAQSEARRPQTGRTNATQSAQPAEPATTQPAAVASDAPDAASVSGTADSAVAPADAVTIADGLLGNVARYRQEQRHEPRPMVLHLLGVDLDQPGVEMAVSVASDPDGEDDAEAVLTSPVALAKRDQLVAAVNTNAFWMLPEARSRADLHWFAGRPIDIMGWCVQDGRTISQPRPGFWALWQDPQGRWHVGDAAQQRNAQAALAISGFHGLLRGGQPLPVLDTAVRAQLAVGVDAAQSRLVVVFVEGRQPGLSEGMTQAELTQMLQAMGVTDAISLDAGSGVMLLEQSPGDYRVLNRSSLTPDQRMRAARPVPVLLGVKKNQ